MVKEFTVKCANCGDDMKTKRVRDANFCSGRCRTAYHRMNDQMTTQFHIALDAINNIGHYMNVRDDLCLRGDGLFSELTNKIHQYQYRDLAHKINRLERELQTND